MKRLALLFCFCAIACGPGAGFGLGEVSESSSADLSVCATDAGTIKGIDVSKYDGKVDWHQVADAGYLFAISRVSDGLNTYDPYFPANWAGSRDAGLVRGVYQFFEPSQDPVKQAQLLLANIPDFAPGDLPPVVDVERLDGLDAGPAAATVQAWVKTIHDARGVRPLIYTSQRVWNELGDAPLDADLWVVNYGVTCPAVPGEWADAGWKLWQYTDAVTVPGDTAEPADIDLFNGSLAQLKAYAGIPFPPQLQLESVEIGPQELDAGDLLTATFVVRNLGQQAVAAVQPAPGTVYDESQPAPLVTGSLRVALGSSDRDGHPWRWGVPKDLAYGQTATVTGQLRVSQPGQRTFYAAVIDESSQQALQDRLGSTTVTIAAPPAQPPLPIAPARAGCGTGAPGWLAAAALWAGLAIRRLRYRMG